MRRNGIYSAAIFLLSLFLVFSSCQQRGNLNPISGEEGIVLDTLFASATEIEATQSVLISAHVIDQDSNSVGDVEVIFETDYGTLTRTSVFSNDSGWAFTTLNTPRDSVVHTATITASVYEQSTKTIVVTVYEYGHKPAVYLDIWVEKDSAVVNQDDSCVVAARLMDDNRNPLLGRQVTFSTSQVGIVVYPVNSGLTDESGVARAYVPSPSTAMQVWIVATHRDSLRDSVQVTFVEDSISSVVLTSDLFNLTANGTDEAVLQVTVYTLLGGLAPDGTRVSLVTTGGNLVPYEAVASFDNFAPFIKERHSAKKRRLPAKLPKSDQLYVYTVNGRAFAKLIASTTVDTAVVSASVSGVSDTIRIYFDPGEPDRVDVVAADTVLTADGRDTTTITATVVDAYSNPVFEGTEVTFSADRGSIYPSITTTNILGVARAVLTSSTTPGFGIISATAGGATGQTSVYFTTSCATSINLMATPSSIPADGNSSTLIRAQVLDENSFPVSDNVSVTFTASDGVLISPRTKRILNLGVVSGFLPKESRFTAYTSDGWAEVMLVSSTVAGTTSVIAEAESCGTGAATDTIFVPFLPGPPNSITVTVGRDSIFADGTDTTEIEATVLDEFSNPVSAGVRVEFSCSDSNARIDPTTSYTDAYGVTRSQVTSSISPGRKTISATAEGAFGQTYIYFVRSYPSSIRLTASPRSITADGESYSELEVYVSDTMGRPAADGTPVDLVSDRGTLMDLAKKTGSNSFASAITRSILSTYRGYTESGYVRLRLVSETIVGTAEVIATVANSDTTSISDTVYVDFVPGEPARIEMSAVPDTLPADGHSTSDITGTVYDEYGNAVGRDVLVSLSTSLGEIIPETVPTDSAGSFSAILTSSATNGIALVEAHAGGAYGQVLVYFQPATPSQIILSSDVSSTQIGAGTITLSALVLDSIGRPVSDGVPVSFSSSLGDVLPPTSYTESGVATAVLSPGTVAGVDTVIATAGIAADTILVRFTAGRCRYITVTATPESIAADGRSRSTIVASLTDEYGNPVESGRLVNFTTNLGSVRSNAYTDSVGRATVYLTSSPTVGRATVEVSCEEGFGECDVEFVVSPAAFISVSANPNRITADGTSRSEVKARLLDTYGNPVADGTIVIFHSYFDTTTTPFGTIDTIATTVGGEATVSLTSETTVGRATIIASLLGLSDTTYVDFVPGEPANITLSISPDSIPADGHSISNISATVRDEYGNPVGSGVRVEFETTLGSIISPVYTDSSGTAQSELTSATEMGRAVVTVTSGEIVAQGFVEFTQLVVASISIYADSTMLVADGRSTTRVYAIAYDSSGVSVADGTPIFFRTTGGFIFPGVAYTDSGMVETTLRASTTPSVIWVTADAGGGVADSININFVPGEPATIELTPVPSDIPANGDTVSTIYGVVKDAQGNLVTAGHIVHFSTTLGEIDSIDITNDIGEVTATLHSGTIPGVALIVATSGDAVGNCQVAFTNSDVGTIVIEAEPRRVPTGGDSTVHITGFVRNSLGNPVSDGTPVIFTLEPDSLGYIVPPTAYTDSGRISAEFISGEYTGGVMIIADAGGISDTATVTIEPGEPESIAIWSDDTTLAADGVSGTNIYAALFDRFGNPVSSGDTVYFETTLGTLSPDVELTGSDGTVRVSLYSSTEAGEAIVRARSGDARTEMSIYFENTDVHTIILSANPSQLVADGFETSVLQAMVYDSLGNPITDGTPIHFAVVSADTLGVVIPTVVHTEGGQATATFRAGTRTGLNTVRAYSGPVSGDADIELIPGPVDRITLTATPDTIPANGVSTSAIEAVLLDRFGNTLRAGEPVSFGASRGTIEPTNTFTDATGTATATLTSSNIPGICRVSAQSGDIYNQITVFFDTTGVGAIVLTANPNKLTADGVSQSTITATVYNSEGTIVSDMTPVYFEVHPDTFGTLLAMRPTIGGTAVNTFTAGTFIGVCWIVASCVVESDTVRDSVRIRLEGGPPTVINVSVDSTSLPANGNASCWVYAQLLDEFGNHAPGGVSVSFETNLGTIETPAITDTSGIARVRITAGLTPGDVSIIARSGEAVGFGATRFVPVQAAVALLTANPVNVVADGESETNVTCEVYDSSGFPVSNGTIVQFSVEEDYGTLIPSVTTTEGGLASVYVRSDTLAVGRRLVTATVIPSAPATDTITGEVSVNFIPGEPSRMDITVTPGEDSIPADGVTTSKITVCIYDRYSNPVGAGIGVSFETSLGEITPTAVTDTLGCTYAILTSSTETGDAIVTVRAGEIIGYTQVTFYRLEAAEIHLVVDPIMLVADGVSEATITADVYDASSLPVSDNTRITFSQDTSAGFVQGVITPRIALTTAGRATATIRAPIETGTCRIIASAGATIADTFDIQFIPGEPAHIVFDTFTTHDTLPADGGLWPVRVYVRDAFENPVTVGTEVRFSTTVGTIVESAVTESDSGVALSYISSSTTGPAVVTAQAGAALGAFPIQFIPIDGDTVFAVANPPRITADGESRSLITVSVMNIDSVDSVWRPVSDGLPVFFTSIGTGILSRNVDYTVGGTASSELTSGYIAGSDTVIVSINAGKSDTVVVIFEPGEPAIIEFSNLPAGTLYANGGDTMTVTVRVLDQFGNVVTPGTGVSFSTTIGSITEVSATDDSGYASSIFTTGLTFGTGVITAQAGSATGYAIVTVHPVEAASISLVVSPNRLIASGEDEANIIATVLDSFGFPVSDGTLVHFRTTAGIVTPPVAATESGVARATLTSTINVLDTVFVVASVGAVRESTIVSFVPGEPAIMEIWSGAATLVANGADTTSIWVRVYDAYGNRVQDGTRVDFETTLGTIVPTAYTEAGSTEVVLTSGLELGWANVTGRSGDATASCVVGFVSTDVVSVRLAVVPSRITADGESTADVLVTVLSAGGSPVSDGTPVWFDSLGFGSIDPVRTITSSGIATATLTSFTTCGTDTLFAFAGDGTHFDSTEIEFLAGEPAVIYLTPDTDEVDADGITTVNISAEVKDAAGNPVNAGWIINFSVDNGSVLSVGATDDSGITSTVYRAGEIPGIATIRASYGGVEMGVCQIRLVNTELYSIVLTADPFSILADGHSFSTLQAHCFTESTGYVTDGTPINFAIAYGEGVLSPSWALTEDGIAEIRLLSTTTAGECSVYAYSGSVASDTVGVTFETGEPAVIIFNPSSMTLVADGSDTGSAVLTVEDAYGNPIPRRAVELQIEPAGKGTVTPTYTVTDDSGRANFTVTAPRASGQAALSATCGGASGLMNLRYTPTPVAEMQLAAIPVIIPADGMSYSNIRAIVLDSLGHPVSDSVSVNFVTTAGYIVPSIAYTLDGVCETRLYSSTSPTSATVTATADTVSETVVVTFTTGVPSELICETDASVLTAGRDESAHITVSVLDTLGNPVGEGYAVRFATTLGGIADSVLLTDIAGTVRTLFQPGTQAGLATITAYLRTGRDSLGCQSFITIKPDSAYGMELSVSDSSIYVRGVGERDFSVIYAHIVDRNGNDVEDSTRVWFRIINAPPPSVPPCTLNPAYPDPAYTHSGIASATFRAGMRSGTVVVQALTLDSHGDTISTAAPRITINSGFPAYISLSGDCNVPGLLIDGIPDTVMIMVTDSMRNPVAEGTAVYLWSNHGSITGVVVTDSLGFAKAVWYSMRDTITDLSTYKDIWVKAEVRTFASPDSIASDSLHFMNTAGWWDEEGELDGVVDSLAIIDLYPDSILADNTSTSTIQVQAWDVNSYPVINGTDIRLMATYGSITEDIHTTNECLASVATGTYTSRTLTRDMSWSALDVADDGVGGWAEIRAFADGVWSNVDTITLLTSYASTDNSELIAPTTLPSGATGSVTIRIRDEFGNPLGGHMVTFSAPSGGSFSVLTGYTNASGSFTTQFTAPMVGVDTPVTVLAADSDSRGGITMSAVITVLAP
ncbi:Ig-like domain-containing protein [bacterium]|nr:Ig-like domain-containing protein [bacterium]